MKTYQSTTLLRLIYKFNHTHTRIYKMTDASHGIQENELDA